MKWLHPSFWVPYEGTTVPTAAQARAAISADCRANGRTCRFLGDDRVEIDGAVYEIYRGYEPGSRGNYGVKCRRL